MLQEEKFKITDWLPISADEVLKQGWKSIDVILFSGDAYVDHPAFGSAVVGRLLQSMGLRVAIVPQPNWRDDLRDFKKLGRPNICFAVSAGNMDSMVNHYTAAKRLRSTDAYTAGGKSGYRPDYPTIVYTQALKKLFPDVPVIIGGIEASLRRLTHYDYWADRLRPSILAESGADMLIYGMGEKPLREIFGRLMEGVALENITDVPQTVFAAEDASTVTSNDKHDDIVLTSHEECLRSKTKFAKNFAIIETESNKMYAHRLLQKTEGKTIVVNPPYPSLDQKELDAVYELPYTRLPHPRYKKRGAVPAYEMIRHSVNIHRGCFGGCAFCTISAHQGKFISSRSEKSILKEVDAITHMPDFKGYISDLGGPSANMYKMHGRDMELCARCKRPSCIFPKICPNLITDHSPLTNLYEKAAAHPKIKKVFIGSGIRYDMLLGVDGKKAGRDKEEYINQVIRYHVSGRLKVAPEHTSDKVLKLMRKPPVSQFKTFKRKFDQVNKKFSLNQQLIPYFISSHPACTNADMAHLAYETREMGYKLEQIQDFTPTPMTLATVIYYTGINPYTLKPVYTAKSAKEKKGQQAFFFWYKPENRHLWAQVQKIVGRK